MGEKKSPYKDGPLISVDVSKAALHYQGWRGFRDPHSKPRKCPMTRSGLEEVLALRSALEAETGADVPLSFEDTGSYSMPLATFLSERGVPYARVSPLLSAKTRKADDRPVKTDARDCATIAECYYTKGKVTAGKGASAADAAELSKMLSACRLDLQRAKCRFRKNLDRVWASWDSEFPDPYRSGPWAAVRSFRHPAALGRAKKGRVVAALEKAGVLGGRAAGMAERMLAYAADALYGCDEGSPAVDALIDSMDDVERLMGRMSGIESRLESCLDAGQLEIVRSIDGVGRSLSLVLLAEIGDARRFKGEKSIVSYAGFDTATSESGTSLKGLHLPITKKGNGRLRWAATMAVRAMGIIGSKNGITAFRDRLVKENHRSREAATVAAASKLLRVVISMLKSGQTFVRE